MPNWGLYVLADPTVKLKEREKKYIYLDRTKDLKKVWNMKVTFIPNLIGARKIINGAGGLGNTETSEDHPNNYIIENGQNTEKYPGDLRRLAVTQTSVKDPQLKLIWKILKE